MNHPEALNDVAGRVSVVIPLHPSHERHLPELFANLNSDSDTIQEVILARGQTPARKESETRDRLERVYERSGMSPGLLIICDERPRTAGENKNAGWRQASARWTAFVDADDLYHPQRLHLLRTLALHTGADLVLHGFTTDANPWTDLESRGSVFGTDELFAATFPNEIRDRASEGRLPGDTNVEVRDGTTPVAQGHSLVLTELRNLYGFSSLRRGEDGQLNRDILWDRRTVLYLDQPLSRYRPDNSTIRNSAWRKWRARLRSRTGLMP